MMNCTTYYYYETVLQFTAIGMEYNLKKYKLIQAHLIN